MRSFFGRSVYVKFLAIQITIFLIALGVGLNVVAQRRETAAREAMGARVGALSAKVAGVISEFDLDQDEGRATAGRLASLLLSDPAVACVEILSREGAAVASAPRGVGCMGDIAPEETLNLTLDDGSQMNIGLSDEELRQARRQALDAGLALAAACIVLAGCAAAFAYRRVIGAPLRRLIRVLRESTRQGRHIRLDHRSDDEIGAVADAFNAMQDRLEDERRETAAARDSLARLYNGSPALMFTLSRRGRILTVSDFCLDALGYARADVVGRPALAFIDRPADRRRAVELLRAGLTRDMPLRVRRRDGRTLDVLFSTVMEAGGEAAHALCVMTDVSALRVAEMRLRRIAMTDSLTGLANRAAYAEALREAASRSDACVFLIDLDRFKQVNDVLGHAAGDAALRIAAARIAAFARPGDLAARLGGDEFALLRFGLDVAEAEAAAFAIRAAFMKPVILDDGATADIGASVGQAFTQAYAGDGEAALRAADAAMYANKSASRSPRRAA